MNYLIRAKDGYGRVTTKLYETEREFLDRLDYFIKLGLKVEAYERRSTWVEYRRSQTEEDAG